MSHTIKCPVCRETFVDSLSGYLNHQGSFAHRAAEIEVIIDNLLNPKPVIPAFNSVTRCPKCNQNFNHPNILYIEKRNVVKRWCGGCSYSWVERCADGSEPIEA